MECHHGGRLEGAFAAVRVRSRVVLCFVIVVTISGVHRYTLIFSYYIRSGHGSPAWGPIRVWTGREVRVVESETGRCIRLGQNISTPFQMVVAPRLEVVHNLQPHYRL